MAFFSHTLQSSNQVISSGDVIGVLAYAASNESSNGDARLISGSIESVAEGDFTAVANPASLVFSTSTSADAVEQMRLTSEGYLGINTQYPTAYLDVNGRATIGTEASSRSLTVGTIEDADFTAAIQILGAGMAGGSEGLLIAESNGGASYIYNYEDDPIYFGTNGTYVGGWGKDGGLMVGTSTDSYGAGSINLYAAGNPRVKFNNIATGSSITDGSEIYLDFGDLIVSNRENADISLKTNNLTRLLIQNDGNVGVGTASPLNKLSVIGSTSFGAFDRTPNNANAAGFYDRIEVGGGTQATKNYGHILVYNTGNIATHWFNSFAGADNYINNGGSLGLGTSTPDYKLDVAYTGGDWGLRVGEVGDSTDGILIGDAQFDARFQGIGHASYTDPDDYIIATSGTDTYIGARTGRDVIIRGGGNVGTYQIRVSDDQCSMGNGLVQVVAGETRFNPANADQDVTFEGLADTQLLAIDAGLDKVAIGTNPSAVSEKLTVEGSISNLYGWTVHSKTGSTTGQGVDNGFYLELSDGQGTTLESVRHYFVQMTTFSTGSRTGASYLVWYETSDATWYTRAIGQAQNISNAPFLTEVSGQLRGYTDHASGYSIRYNVSSYYTNEADSRPHSMGANYHWQRLTDDLYYNDGNVAVNSGNLTVGVETAGLQGADQGIHIHATTTPEIKLTNSTTGSAATDGGVMIMSSDNMTIRNRESAGLINLVTGPGNAAIVADSSQRVGINITPSYRLHSKDGSGEFFHSGFGAYVRGTGGNGVYNVLTNGSGTWAMSTDENHDFKLWKGNYGVSNNDVLTIKDTGLIKQLNTLYSGTPTELDDIFNKYQAYNDGSIAGGVGVADGHVSFGATGPGISVNYYGASGIAFETTAAGNTGFYNNTGGTIAYFDGNQSILNFGTAIGTAGTPNKIRFYHSSDTYCGIGVSPASLDYISTSDINHNFYHGTTRRLLINNGGLVVNPDGGTTTSLRVYGDTDTELLYTHSATDRVGIGYTGPQEKLHVDGNIKATNSDGSNVSSVIASAGTNELVLRAKTSSPYNFVGSLDQHPVSLGAAGNELQLVLGNTNANYNVSIGANPVNNAAFQVYKSTPSTGSTSYFNSYHYTAVQSGVITALRGIQTDTALVDGVDLTNYYAYTTGSVTLNGNANVNTTIGMYVNNATFKGSASNYGIYSDMASGIDVPATYGIFMAGSAENFMRRGMQIAEADGAIGSDYVIDHIENAHTSFNAQNETGYLKIRLPLRPTDNTKWTNTMVMFDVEIYDYRTPAHGGSGKKFTFGGYTYSTSKTWIHPTASCAYYDSDEDSENPWVAKFCQDPDGYPCVLLYRRDSVENTDWDYPQVTISNVRAGFSNFTYEHWSKGWEVSLEQSADINGDGYVNQTTKYISVPYTSSQLKYNFYSGGTGRSVDHTNHVVFGSAASIFNLSQNNVDFRVAGDNEYDLLFVDASRDNVGIGTSTPIANLHVADDAGPVLMIGTNSNIVDSVCSLHFQDRVNASDQDSGGQVTAYVQVEREGGAADYDMTFGVIDENQTAGDAVEKMRLTSTGNLGIGTSAPSKRLHVDNTGVGAGTSVLIQGDDDSYVSVQNSNTGDFLKLGSIYTTNAYMGLSHSDINNAGYMIMSNGQHTFLSGNAGGRVYIRGGKNNTADGEIQVGDGLVQVNPNGVNVDFIVEGDTDANLLRTDASADTVQIGSSVTSSNAKLYVYDNPVNNGSAGMAAIYGRVESSVTTNGTNYDMGLRSRVEKEVASGVVDGGYALGANIVALLDGPGTLTEMTCVRANGGTYYNAAGGGTITNYYGYRHIPVDVTSNDSTITTGYGIHLAALPTNTTSRYGVFQVGPDDHNRFAGPMTIGSTAGHRSGYQMSCHGHMSTERVDAKFVAVDNSTIFTKLQSSVSNNFGLVGTESNHNFNFRTNNIDRGRFLSTGELQIGTVTGTPNALLDCVGSIASTDGTVITKIESDSANSVGYIGTESDHDLVIRCNNLDAIELSSFDGSVHVNADNNAGTPLSLGNVESHSPWFGVRLNSSFVSAGFGPSSSTKLGGFGDPGDTCRMRYYGGPAASGDYWLHESNVQDYEIIPFVDSVSQGTRLKIETSGRVTIGSDTLNISASGTPASSSATGTEGDIMWDADYVYVCVGTNSWKRTSISTW